MKLTIFDGNINRCFGCGACFQICPKGAITMLPNDEGFLFPLINNDACIECNLCSKVCPVVEQNLAGIQNPLSSNVYAAWNNDKAQLMESTSGGIFPLLANVILSKGGIVYGCAWAENEIRAIQVRIDSNNELIKLKGSKYVQSSTEKTYLQVRNDLNEGKLVLYSGTPCIIAGLKLFLQKEYQNLYLIDLVCHGVPSPKMLTAYVNYSEKKEGYKLKNLQFRDKRESGWRTWVSWEKPNAKKAYKPIGLEPYMKGFFQGFFNRESCYCCSMASPRRLGDVTLADYWGIELSHPELTSKQKYGISLVLSNNKNGDDLLNGIITKATLVRSSFENAAKKNPCLLHPDPRPATRNNIYVDLNNKDFDFLANTCLKPKLAFIRKLIPSWAKNIIKELRK